ncbi:MAG: RdgB/HAM1 family non-canonical purine NTP pyrophosphatase [Ghiorsea sp.]
MNIQQLVIASNNKKKRSEIENILKTLGIEVVAAENTVFVDVVEDGDTFAANAKKKADAFMLANQLPALADDSGLCVSALNDAPGVYSARFAGESATDDDNNKKLLADLSGLNERSAHFMCSLHLSALDGSYITAEGRVEGLIIDQETGDTGFGYDPLFFSPELNKTFAQSHQEEKAAVSHRGRALRKLKSLLE